jgi:hypothetical protein
MLSQESSLNLSTEGETDGYSCRPPDPNYRHDITYIAGYIKGIQRWKQELERREAEMYSSASTEF